MASPQHAKLAADDPLALTCLAATPHEQAETDPKHSQSTVREHAQSGGATMIAPAVSSKNLTSLMRRPIHLLAWATRTHTGTIAAGVIARLASYRAAIGLAQSRIRLLRAAVADAAT